MHGGLVWSMAQNTIKLNNVTKDFAMKSKDILAVLEECGIPKKTGATLEALECEILIECLTKKNEIRNLDDYLDGKATIVSDRPKVEKKPEAPKVEGPKEEKKPEAPKAEAKPEEKKVEAPKAEKKPEEKKPEAPKAEKKPEAKKPEAKPEAPKMEKKPEEKKPEAPKAAERPGVPGLHLRPVDKPKTLPQNQPGLHLRPVDKPKTPVAGANNKPAQGQQQAQPQTRPVTPVTKPQQPKKQEKKPPKKAEKQALRTILPMAGASTPEGSGEAVVAKAPKTRVVDTRTTDVDLSSRTTATKTPRARRKRIAWRRRRSSAWRRRRQDRSSWRSLCPRRSPWASLPAA